MSADCSTDKIIPQAKNAEDLQKMLDDLQLELDVLRKKLYTIIFIESVVTKRNLCKFETAKSHCQNQIIHGILKGSNTFLKHAHLKFILKPSSLHMQLSSIE
jgi:hypothetical protein